MEWAKSTVHGLPVPQRCLLLVKLRRWRSDQLHDRSPWCAPVDPCASFPFFQTQHLVWSGYQLTARFLKPHRGFFNIIDIGGKVLQAEIAWPCSSALPGTAHFK